MNMNILNKNGCKIEKYKFKLAARHYISSFLLLKGLNDTQFNNMYLTLWYVYPVLTHEKYVEYEVTLTRHGAAVVSAIIPAAARPRCNDINTEYWILLNTGD